MFSHVAVRVCAKKAISISILKLNNNVLLCSCPGVKYDVVQILRSSLLIMISVSPMKVYVSIDKLLS